MLDSDGRTAETASVIAARQLAEEARLRRLPSALRRRRRPVAVPPPRPPTDAAAG